MPKNSKENLYCPDCGNEGEIVLYCSVCNKAHLLNESEITEEDDSGILGVAIKKRE